MAQLNSAITARGANWRSRSVTIALLIVLAWLIDTRAFDVLRAVGSCLRARKSPAMSLVRIDQETEWRGEGYVVARIGR